MSDYMIHLSRREGRYTASIPELCIAEEAASPEDALAGLLKAESEVVEQLKSSGLPLPPPVDRIRPLPKVRESLVKSVLFFGKVAAAFIIFLILTGAFAAIIYPSFDSRVREYLQSPASKEQVGRVLKHLGISVCIEDESKSKTGKP
jgi:predicted RNase H-like HicB family nuclease